MNCEILLGQIKDLILSAYPTAEIILYGSRSKGWEKEGSDWDILVIVEQDLKERDKIDIQNQIYEIELTTREIINVVVHTRKEWSSPLFKAMPFYADVMNEGIRI